MMGIESFPGFLPPITKLFRLANGSFEPLAFRQQCEKIGTFNASCSSHDTWRFSLAGGATLTVALNTQQTERKKPNGWPEYRVLAVCCAMLPVCLWGTFLHSEHLNLRSWQSEREEFDRCFWAVLSRATEILGAPRIQGSDTDEDRYRFAIWRGETGLLTLQQSAFDPQFGHEVSYWVKPWSGCDPEPTSPFIDWLCRAQKETV
jgi:hypothetical protein